MTYERDEYMRRQEAEHAMIRMREPARPPWFNPLVRSAARAKGWRTKLDPELVCRIIERAEIAPIIKQRLISEVLEASAIEARRAATGTGAVHESAVTEGQTP